VEHIIAEMFYGWSAAEGVKCQELTPEMSQELTPLPPSFIAVQNNLILDGGRLCFGLFSLV
jgi:hypothetical protein